MESTKLTRRTIVEIVRDYFSRPGAVYAYTYDPEDPGFCGESKCVYRGQGDASSPVRCALGVLIPDDVYDPEWEGMTASQLTSGAPEVRALFADDVSPDWLDMLQGTHDNAARDGDSLDTFLDHLAGLPIA